MGIAIYFWHMNTTITKSAGMGAIVSDGTVTFRVWAPNAEKVFVAGSFNNWSESEIPLELEENGYWSVVTDMASPGDEYKYFIEHEGSLLPRNDPYAFEVTNSNGNSVIRTLDFDWDDDDFEMRKSSTMNSMYIGSTISKPNVESIINAVATILHSQMLEVSRESDAFQNMLNWWKLSYP